MHPFNDEGCAPSIKRLLIRPFASSPSGSANCAQPGGGHKSAWPRNQICTEPISVGSNADCEISRCITSLNSRTPSRSPSRTYFQKVANLDSRGRDESGAYGAAAVKTFDRLQSFGVRGATPNCTDMMTWMI